jgi:hypothetical protein
LNGGPWNERHWMQPPRSFDALVIGLAFLAGAALLIVGSAWGSPRAADWLGFIGNILGSGLAAFTAFALIGYQETRAADARRRVAREAVGAVKMTLERFHLVATGDKITLSDSDTAHLLRADILLQAASSSVSGTDPQALLTIETLRLKLGGDWQNFLNQSMIANSIVAAGARRPVLSEEVGIFSDLISACDEARKALA